MKKYILPVVLIAAATSALSFWGFKKFSDTPFYIEHAESMPVHYAAQTYPVSTQPVDFSQAARQAVPCVVHITTLTKGRTIVQQAPFDPFGMLGMARQIPAQMASGSGVLISSDGYIVTNNHVVQGADKVQVTFDNRDRQIAKVIGTDPSTDLAVIKIEGNHFPYMTLGNSDSVQIGQWVLAVGYPLNLDCTVTAGIVSGKSRSIDLPEQNRQQAIQAYIQTDAAVNPGNSGGPLVNTSGQLVGINSAIASPTGSYAGYSYAIPSNIVRKVANDIIKYGHTQRGYLGVAVVGLNKLSIQDARQLGMSKEEFQDATGVYVSNVLDGSAASKAGLKKGDFITAVNGVTVNSSPELLEQISLYHPGDKIKIDYRNGDESHTVNAILQNSQGEDQLLANAGSSEDPGAGYTKLGARLEAVSSEEARKLNIDGGVRVTALSDGVLKNETNIRPGFIIFRINGHAVRSVADVNKYVQESPHKLRIAGTYPGENGIYYFGLQNGG
ncbi:MAG TPA: trypsin-like peptidase domain-containing protein [Edaphocola sp.]|nr:trypsin-like peptidase domain-containing protein [Edaphocola sp.]